MTSTVRPVSTFGGGRSDLQGITPELVGFKAYNLMRMDGAGLPVPPGFVLHTSLCREFLAGGGRLPHDVAALLREEMRALEGVTGLRFGDDRRPLLVSVRSGAPVSMPGMMDTLLDIGLTDTTMPGLIRRTGNPHLAWDSYRRLVLSYVELLHPEAALDAVVRERLDAVGAARIEDLDTRGLRDLTRALLARTRGATFPQEPYGQLSGAVEAVFRSWNSDRAIAYRRMQHLDGGQGTAVIVQAMVFGNAGGRSGSGVGFTRNPATGANELYFDFAFDAQGEDVVAGRRSLSDPMRLSRVMPSIYSDLLQVRRRLEREFGDMQDFEFTIEDGELFLLQTRAGKRTPRAAIQIAVALAEEGLMDAAEALARVSGIDITSLDVATLEAAGPPLASAIAASAGIAAGPIALDSAAAQAAAARGEAAILVRIATETEDIEGFAAAAGILTATGGRTSHAAVVARQMAKVCLVGCETLEVDLQSRTCTIGGQRFAEGERITLDGDTGRIYDGLARILRGTPATELAALDRLRLLAQVAP